MMMIQFRMKQLLRMLTLIQVRMLIMIISKQMMPLMQVRMLIKQMMMLMQVRMLIMIILQLQFQQPEVRGQGYDGASNMQGEFNGLKALILKDNPSAHYIHCFAHQLQLVIVAVTKKHAGVKTFYEFLPMIVTTVSASCKRKDMLKEEKKARVEKEILEGEIKTGKGLNQEVSLARAGDTRWGSHHRTIISLLRLFSEVVTVFQYVKEDGDCSQQRTNAKGILSYFKNSSLFFICI
ncbi:putative ribonuclease H-like superfamily [Helianthus annuus]|nr:putative ribonuclease H-like superfamily [Helianthus annuus]